MICISVMEGLARAAHRRAGPGRMNRGDTRGMKAEEMWDPGAPAGEGGHSGAMPGWELGA